MPLNVSPAPITDPNDPNYDATKDPNSPEYQAQQPGPDDLSLGTQTPPAAPSNLDPSGVSPGEQSNPSAVNPNLGPEITPDNAWQLYAVQAVNALYPRLRNGVDYAIGRNALDQDVELLATAESVDIDWGKVREEAQAMADRDPYAAYEPKPSLAPGNAPVGTQGEMPPPPTF